MMQASSAPYSVTRDRRITTASPATGYYPHATYTRHPASGEFVSGNKPEGAHLAYVDPPIHYQTQPYCQDTTTAAATAAAVAAAAAGLPNTSLPPLSQLLPSSSPSVNKHQSMSVIPRSVVQDESAGYYSPGYDHDRNYPLSSALPAHKHVDAMISTPHPSNHQMYPAQRPQPPLYFMDPTAAAAAAAAAGMPPSNYSQELQTMPGTSSLAMFPTPPATAMGHYSHRPMQHSNNTLPSPPPSVADSMHSDPQKVFSFVSLPGVSHKKRPRRKYHEVERLYHCNYDGCNKAYGTLNHLNAHVCMQNHGLKRHPSEFKELRKFWRKQKREQQQDEAEDPNEDSPTLEDQQLQDQQQQHPNTIYQWGSQQQQTHISSSAPSSSMAAAGYGCVTMPGVPI